jgi:deazaflavin-dependent oxidoreductase (nitroreductase family)
MTSRRGGSGSAYLRLVRRIGHRRWFLALGRRWLFPIDRWIQRLTRGRIASIAPRGLPILVLTVAGRRTGERRSVPVVYLEDGDRLVVVASNWGAERHPAWSDNLLAASEASVGIGGRERPVRVRPADPSEKQALWPRLLSVWPAWTDYEALSGRDLRVFLLEPVPDPEGTPH